LSRKRHVLQRRVCGRRFRILNIVDDVTRECLAAIPDTSISGKRVAREPTVLIQQRGKPGMIVSDHGTEPNSNAVLAWCSEHRTEWHHIAPGKPMQNGYIESFNGRTRDELEHRTKYGLRPNVLPAQQACPGYRPRLSTRPSRSCHGLLSLLPSWPALCRPSTSVNRSADKTWIPGTSPGMTTRDKPGDDDGGWGGRYTGGSVMHRT
jgi:transposase InsO family protein